MLRLKVKHICNRLMIFGICAIGSVWLLFSPDTHAVGKYPDQGRRLSIALNQLLISKGFCAAPPECFDLLPGYTDHESTVRINYYEVGDRNFAAFLEIVGFLLKEGTTKTDNVPIRIKGYRETHDQVRTSGLFIKRIKPFMDMEVTK